MAGLVMNDRSIELKKHINAIHCSNNLSLVQRKLFNALLFNAYPDLPFKQQFEIRGKDLYQLIGYNSKDTAKLKEALLGLITIAIEWNVVDCTTGQEKKWKASSILASAELSNGFCIYEYSQVMKSFLYQPEIYGQIDMALLAKFKSSYGLALYENCIRYKSLAQTPWFPVDIFRKLMGVFDGKYPVFKDFKKRVLDIGIEEVNALSPIRIVPEIERTNQKVTRIRFKIEKSPIEAMPCPVRTEEGSLKQALIETFNFSEAMLDETFARYDKDYIQNKIELVLQSENFMAGKIRGLAGYLVEALKKDYQPSKSSKAFIQDRHKHKEAQLQAEKAQVDAQTERYKQYVLTKINGYLRELDENQKQGLIQDFESFIASQSRIFKNWYQKHGLEHPAIKACFHGFIKDKQPKELGTLLAQEEYLQALSVSL